MARAATRRRTSAPSQRKVVGSVVLPTIVATLLVAAGLAATLTLLRRARTTGRPEGTAGIAPGDPEGPGGVPAVQPAPDPHLPVVAASAGVGPRAPQPVRPSPPAEEPVAVSLERATYPMAPAARRAAKNSGTSRFGAGRPASRHAASWAAPRA